MELHLLDANITITAHNSYYPIDQVPEFWSWLKNEGAFGHVKIPLEIMEEIKQGRKENDLLIEWISQPENEEALLLNESVDSRVSAARLSNRLRQ